MMRLIHRGKQSRPWSTLALCVSLFGCAPAEPAKPAVACAPCEDVCSACRRCPDAHLAEPPSHLPHHHPADHSPPAGESRKPTAGDPELQAAASTEQEPRGLVIQHAELRHFENNGNDLVGIATPSQGATDVEVWRSSVAPGSSTPLHRHESEEIFVVLQGSGVAEIGDQRLPFRAPATVIAPPGVPHRIVNTGDVPTDSIVIVGSHSSIYDADGQKMDLPWRR